MLIEDLYTALKIISIIGLIITSAMMVAVTFKKLQSYYPEEVEKHRWVFVVAAILIAFVLVFIFEKFFVPK